MRSRSAARNVRRLLAVMALGAMVAAGCLDGQPPTEVIDQRGAPEDFLPPPPGGILPGTFYESGNFYRFDRTRYRLFLKVPGTDPRFVRNDSVLALATAGNPGAPISMLLRPDLSDPTLAEVYANPRLFGFRASVAPDIGFVEGRAIGNSAGLYPVSPGNWWQHNHNFGEWQVTDSIVPGTGTPPTAGPGYQPVFHLVRESDVVVGAREPALQPPLYTADIFGTVNGAGIFYHAWSLIAERDIPRGMGRDDRDDRQRNPRFLWLSIQSLDFSRDPTASPPVTTDQCLDALPGYLQLFPFKLCGEQVREGDIYTTWTYLTVDEQVLRQRLNSEAQEPRGGRCGTDIPVGTDTLRMFPTRNFRLLCKFESRCERITDQVEIRLGTDTKGLYPRTPRTDAIVQFDVTMYIGAPGREVPVQFLEMWFMRDFGPVITRMGVDVITRTESRMSACFINGQLYDQSNDYQGQFSYSN